MHPAPVLRNASHRGIYFAGNNSKVAPISDASLMIYLHILDVLLIANNFV